GRATDVLAVQRVLDLALDKDGDRLVHLVADHAALDRALLFISIVHGRLLLLLAKQRVDASNFAAHAAGLVGPGQLAGCLLHAEREALLLQIKQVGLQLSRGLAAQFLGRSHQRTVRVTNWVVTESFAAARRNASRAIASSTPSIS